MTVLDVLVVARGRWRHVPPFSVSPAPHSERRRDAQREGFAQLVRGWCSCSFSVRRDGREFVSAFARRWVDA